MRVTPIPVDIRTHLAVARVTASFLGQKSACGLSQGLLSEENSHAKEYESPEELENLILSLSQIFGNPLSLKQVNKRERERE